MTKTEDDPLSLQQIRAEMQAAFEKLTKESAEFRAACEVRIADLEKRAALFDEHRQSWINLNTKLKQMKEETEFDLG